MFPTSLVENNSSGERILIIGINNAFLPSLFPNGESAGGLEVEGRDHRVLIPVHREITIFLFSKYAGRFLGNFRGRENFDREIKFEIR